MAERTALDIRASDAERDEVTGRLAEALVEGRLNRLEFDERMEEAVAARTRGQLAALTEDLPARPRPSPRPLRPRSLPLTSASLLVVTAVSLVVLMLDPRTPVAAIAALLALASALLAGVVKGLSDRRPGRAEELQRFRLPAGRTST